MSRFWIISYLWVILIFFATFHFFFFVYIVETELKLLILFFDLCYLSFCCLLVETELIERVDGIWLHGLELGAKMKQRIFVLVNGSSHGYKLFGSSKRRNGV